MGTPLLISRCGSDRATAYNMSCKLIRSGQFLYTAWLDCPPTPGAASAIRFGVCGVDGAGQAHLEVSFALGEGADNHCGPAMARDSSGRLHLVTGAHHGDFGYRWSDEPADPASWSAPEWLGPGSTYPSLVADEEDTLHLAYREKGDRWQLRYRRRPAGESWSPPRALVESPTPGYNHFMQSLSAVPGGPLHLTFQFHHTDTGDIADCRGRGAAHLESSDGGSTWHNGGDRLGDAPPTMAQLQLICRRETGVSISNHVVDDDGQPWLFSIDPESPSGLLWHRGRDGWRALDLALAFGCEHYVKQSSTLSRDGAGNLHLVLPSRPDGRQVAWTDPGVELHHVVLAPDGALLSRAQITSTAGEAPNWLPSLETWNAVSHDSIGADGHWLLSTRGRNAGGIGGDNRNTVATEVWLRQLAPV